VTSADTRRLDRSRRRILIADDSATYRSVASRVLEDAGYLVAQVADGLEAVDRLIEAEPGYDLLILELNLPRLRGLDVLRRARERSALGDMRVLVVSESLTEHLRTVLAELRLDATLTKNHALRELLYQADALLFPAAGDERRRPRRLGQLPVNYWVEDELYLQSCFDLSEVGMFVAVADEAPPAVGTELSLRFWLPSCDRLVVCEGVVVWQNTAAGDLRITHPPGMGVDFTSVAAADVELIRQYLERS